jgi:hypothetical protein
MFQREARALPVTHRPIPDPVGRFKRFVISKVIAIRKAIEFQTAKMIIKKEKIKK